MVVVDDGGEGCVKKTAKVTEINKHKIFPGWLGELQEEQESQYFQADHRQSEGDQAEQEDGEASTWEQGDGGQSEGGFCLCQ